MALLDQTPKFSRAEAAGFLQQYYGLQGELIALPSERDQNFRVRAWDGGETVLKIANAAEDPAFLAAQHQVMEHLGREGVACPKVVETRTGERLVQISAPGIASHLLRLVSYLPGTPYGEVRRRTPALFASLGGYLGRLDRALSDFEHPALQRNFHWDLANGLAVVNQYRDLVEDEVLCGLVAHFAVQFERDVSPLLPGLPKSAIHNDANDYNVIVDGAGDLDARGQQVAGIIDFGDMVHSYTVADLAVAMAYAVLDQPDPLRAALPLAAAYHRERPLRAAELAALWGLATMRLCMSVCLAAHQTRQRPDDPYLSISQRAIRAALPRLAEIHPRYAEAALREACGLAPLPDAEKIMTWLRNSAQPAPVLGIDLGTEPLAFFDLSVGSPDVTVDQTETELTAVLSGRMAAAGASVGVGLYDEARLQYLTPAFATGEKITDEHRSVHLGIDLFCVPGRPVYAPLEGRVAAFHDNAVPGDYGPVVLLEHHTPDGNLFYTLYGHLSRESLAGLKAGRRFAAGEQLGAVGAAQVNGGWTPHLHFQLILDPLELGCDFPGVCRASQRSVWKAFSPDPNLILRIPEDRLPTRELEKSETLARRKQLIGRNLSIGYREPVKVVRGWRQYLYDETGRQFVDAYNNVPHVGHCHLAVVAAGRAQMGVLNTNTRYLHDHLNRYAEKLTATLPVPLSVCFFVNSGSEANELALRLARAYSGGKDMLVMESAYHGHTTSLIDISPYKHDGPGGRGAPSWVHTVPIPDTYRGAYKSDDPEAGIKYARHVEQAIERIRQAGSGLAGFIAETCPSVGGQIFLPEGYLSQVYEYVRRTGGVCIADEVQTGYGRTGTHFYAFEAHDVVPDIVVLGKPIGNGHPIGAVVTRPEIAEAFDNGMEFFSTFGGNTVSCAIGMAVLEVVQKEGLQAHALEVGAYLLAGLRRLGAAYDIVGDVRGSGLFLGVELVRDRESLEPADREAAFVANRMRQLGILLGTDGPYHNVVKIRPPMPFSVGDADLLLAALERVLWEDFASYA